jgi:hypothetical protein
LKLSSSDTYTLFDYFWKSRYTINGVTYNSNRLNDYFNKPSEDATLNSAGTNHAVKYIDSELESILELNKGLLLNQLCYQVYRYSKNDIDAGKLINSKFRYDIYFSFIDSANSLGQMVPCYKIDGKTGNLYYGQSYVGYNPRVSDKKEIILNGTKRTTNWPYGTAEVFVPGNIVIKSFIDATTEFDVTYPTRK